MIAKWKSRIAASASMSFRLAGRGVPHDVARAPPRACSREIIQPDTDRRGNLAWIHKTRAGSPFLIEEPS
jgi:hypothetical protein